MTERIPRTSNPEGKSVTGCGYSVEKRIQSGEQFRLLVEAVTEYALFMLDPAGCVTTWNVGARRIHGYVEEEILGRHFSVFYTAEDVRAGVPEEVLRGAARDGQWTGEGWRVRKDGRLFWAHVTITALRSNEGELYGFAKVTRDMTEQGRRESGPKFRALAEDAPVGILLIQDDRLKYTNKALARMYGYTPGEITNQTYSDKLVHPADRERVRKNIEMRLGGERESMKFRFRGVTKEKEVIYVEAYGTRIDYRGRPAIIGIDIDITDRLQLQRDVLRVQEEERRRLGQDLHDGVASHLTGVAIMLGALARHAALNDSLTHRIREIQKLVNESCEDVRRLSRGFAPAGLSEEGLPAALERLAANIENGRFEKRGDVPDLEDDTAAHLYWIAREAVANARKYAEAGAIAVRLVRAADTLVLEVEDDGKGFDVSSVEHEGLGLRTMQYRAELLGAEFTVDACAGEGARIRLRLPV